MVLDDPAAPMPHKWHTTTPLHYEIRGEILLRGGGDNLK